MRLPASQPLPRPPPFAGGGGRSGPSTGGRRQSFVVSWGMAEAVVAAAVEQDADKEDAHGPSDGIRRPIHPFC